MIYYFFYYFFQDKTLFEYILGPSVYNLGHCCLLLSLVSYTPYQIDKVYDSQLLAYIEISFKFFVENIGDAKSFDEKNRPVFDSAKANGNVDKSTNANTKNSIAADTAANIFARGLRNEDYRFSQDYKKMVCFVATTTAAIDCNQQDTTLSTFLSDKVVTNGFLPIEDSIDLLYLMQPICSIQYS